MNTAIYSLDTILFNLHMMTLIYRWNDALVWVAITLIVA